MNVNSRGHNLDTRFDQLFLEIKHPPGEKSRWVSSHIPFILYLFIKCPTYTAGHGLPCPVCSMEGLGLLFLTTQPGPEVFVHPSLPHGTVKLADEQPASVLYKWRQPSEPLLGIAGCIDNPKRFANSIPIESVVHFFRDFLQRCCWKPFNIDDEELRGRGHYCPPLLLLFGSGRASGGVSGASTSGFGMRGTS